MPAKKKPLTKTESNKLYAARKKAREEAAMFEAALEAPPAEIIITDDVVDTLPDDGVDLPPPTNPYVDVEDYEPYAPSPDNVPLAKGETKETAIKPGDWHSIENAGDSLEESVVEHQDTLRDDSIPDKHSMPLDSVERLQQAIDGIKWLSQKVKNLPPRTKEILRLRIIRLEELIRVMQ